MFLWCSVKCLNCLIEGDRFESGFFIFKITASCPSIFKILLCALHFPLLYFFSLSITSMCLSLLLCIFVPLLQLVHGFVPLCFAACLCVIFAGFYVRAEGGTVHQSCVSLFMLGFTFVHVFFCISPNFSIVSSLLPRSFCGSIHLLS